MDRTSHGFADELVGKHLGSENPSSSTVSILLSMYYGQSTIVCSYCHICSLVLRGMRSYYLQFTDDETEALRY